METTLTFYKEPNQEHETTNEELVFIVTRQEVVTTTKDSKLTVVDIQNYLNYLNPQIGRVVNDYDETERLQNEWDRWNDIKVQIEATF